jgi:hypothetical protein
MRSFPGSPYDEEKEGAALVYRTYRIPPAITHSELRPDFVRFYGVVRGW